MAKLNWNRPQTRGERITTCRFCSNPIEAKINYGITTSPEKGKKVITVASKSISVCKTHAEILYPDIEGLLTEGNFPQRINPPTDPMAQAVGYR